MRTSSSLLKQITALALFGIMVLVAACGTLEVGIERPAGVATADQITEDSHTSDRVPEVTATPTSGFVSVAAADLEAMVESLNLDLGNRTLVVYPADQAAALSESTEHPVVPLSIDADWSPKVIDAALAIILPSSGLVDVVIASQGMIGLVPQVRTALEQRLYRLDDTEMYGASEHHAFVAGPQEPMLEPIGAAFEGSIELVAGGVLDKLQPAKPLRMAFDWRAKEHVDESLVMFAHLVREDHLIAQRDAVPGNGLFPVESWGPGEMVRDQFALQLPPELPPGTYEVRVGIYDSMSGQRRNLRAPEGGSYVVVQGFEVAHDGPTETATTVTPTPEFMDWDVHAWSSSSPDGEWTAQTTAAFPLDDGTYIGEDHYYERLQVVGGEPFVEWTVVDKWSPWALGYTTPQPFHWSRDGRYLFFTNLPTPDGCGLFANGSDLHRLDLGDGTVSEIVPSVGLVLSLSPDEKTLAYVGYRDKGLTLRDLETGEERSVDMDGIIQGSTGSLIWSPDGNALLLTVASPKCAPEDHRTHSIVRVDVETLSTTTLIAQDPRLFTTTEWPKEERAVLTDSNGDHWAMDPVTGQLVREE